MDYTFLTDFPVTGISKHFQIGSNNTFKGTCKRGIPVDLFDMLELGHAIKEMEVNTKYWINSTNIGTYTFLLLTYKRVSDLFFEIYYQWC